MQLVQMIQLGQSAGFSEHANEHSYSIKVGYLSITRLFKDSTSFT
jgi:hypothetical protein